jgi:inner membrane protein
MHREGHIGAALVAYAPVGAVALALGFETLALVGAAAAGGLSMLPDYDQRVPGLNHRGPTHTVWFALLVALVLGILGGLAGRSTGPLAVVGLAVFGVALGFLTIGSHVLADALTPAGVRPFAPYRDRHYTYDLARASNPIANYALLAVGVIAVLVAFSLGNL